MCVAYDFQLFLESTIIWKKSTIIWKVVFEKNQILPLPDPEPKFQSKPNPKHDPEPEPNKRTQSYENIVDNLDKLQDWIIIQQDKLDTRHNCKKGTQNPQVRSVTKSVQR